MAGAGFGPTRKSTVPLPWPLVDEANVIQDAVVEADHVQSRVVSMATVPEPPAAGTLESELLKDSSHFEVVGAAGCVEDEEDVPHPAITRHAMTAEVSGTARFSSPIFWPRDYARGRPWKTLVGIGHLARTSPHRQDVDTIVSYWSCGDDRLGVFDTGL